MKKMRRLIPAIAMLLVSAVMLSTASFAWFTIGTEAYADGMEVSASAASSLLIVDGDTDNGEQDVTVLFNDADNKITFEKKGDKLEPASYVKEEGEDKNTLYTLADATLVDHVSGAHEGDEDNIVPATEKNYVVYTAYIATAGAAMSNDGQTLKATISMNGGTAYISNAVTVDVWVLASAEDEEATFAGRTNGVAMATAGVEIDLKVGTVPCAYDTEDEEGNAVDGDYITVIMYVYYDGALVDETLTGDKAGYTYVRNDMISTAGATLAVEFAYN